MSANRPILAHHFASLEQQRAAATLGMWAFLATEVLFFGGLFLAYTVYRWSYPDVFVHASRRLDLFLGTSNTIILITSSLTMALAVHAAQFGRRRAIILFLLLTVLLGGVFLGIKFVEYAHDYEARLIPGLAFDEEAWLEQGLNPGHAKLYFVLYFIMTGLHALHMIAGMAVILVLVFLIVLNRIPAEHDTPVEVTGLYWHFVDIVWIFLFPLFYLVGTRSGM